jgi:hypothetical protein
MQICRPAVRKSKNDPPVARYLDRPKALVFAAQHVEMERRLVQVLDLPCGLKTLWRKLSIIARFA